MAEKNTDREFVEYIVKSLVNHPEDVSVERKVDEMGVLLTLKVNPADMALVIGKRGSTAIAIRTLARIIGLRNHALVNFKIAEPEGSTHSTIAQGDEQGRTMRMKKGEMDPERSREGPSRTNEFVRGPQRAPASYGMESVIDELKSSE